MNRAAVTMSQAFLLAAVATAGCGPETVDMPVAPFEQETNAIVASYEMPTGTLDTAKLEQTADEARARLEDLNLDWLPNLLSEALVRLKTRFNDEGLPSDPAAPAEEERARVQAVVNLTRICRGWDDPTGPIDAAQNGRIELTAVVDATQLRRQAWGTAVGCHGRLDPVDTPVLDNTALGQGVNGFLDGSLIIYLYGPLPSTAGEASFLLAFSGTIGRQDQQKSVSFDFRVVNRQVEFRHAVPDGDIIVGVGPTSLTLRGSNATVTCDLLATPGALCH
jgi:hypothetical protein